ncbi:AraC family transcriptional regulator [Streptomyces sp. 1331.2]|uniref:AraC family transcriptional regulator n=1 Tax=Streptomyces sp. 1331.2 TaxID=1938835 RepID=UPI000BCA2341|nr:AraC family transcriptional regulator [Streptomyces sp. 1331.2]SOB85545.1 AraC-type DNA-binding protein [Streptomyces sp. 1331.2]
MDVFDELLGGLRAEGAVFGRSVLTPPWALRFADAAELTLCVPLAGEGWIVREAGARAVRVREGETAVVRGPEPFVFAADPADAGRPELLRDVRCTEADGLPGTELDGRTGGEAEREPAGGAVLMAGAYRVRGEVPQRLLRALPPVLVVPDDEEDLAGCAALRDFFQAQFTAGRPGRQIVVDRLLDWLLVCTLRDWFDRPEAAAPGWYRAQGDEVVGPVLRAMHRAPERPWTLAGLAAEAGVSRTTLAKRFTELVGEPPLTYLTQWRMARAADLLVRSPETVAAVARRVGYADAFGFSAAFKRVRGVTPSAHRRAVGVG